MTFVDATATVLIGVLAGALSVLAGGGVTVVLPVLLALGLTADQANATSRLNLTVGGIIATIVLIRKKKIEWKSTLPLLVATVAGAIVGAYLGTLIHSNEAGDDLDRIGFAQRQSHQQHQHDEPQDRAVDGDHASVKAEQGIDERARALGHEGTGCANREPAVGFEVGSSRPRRSPR
jgi:hypothetical protein